MKTRIKKYLKSLVFLSPLMALAASPPDQNITWFWPVPVTYAGGYSNITWKLYSSPDINLPRSNWVARVVFPTIYTNNGVLWYSNTIATTPGAAFVGLSASNFWEVPFTVAVALPPTPPTPALGVAPGPF